MTNNEFTPISGGSANPELRPELHPYVNRIFETTIKGVRLIATRLPSSQELQEQKAKQKLERRPAEGVDAQIYDDKIDDFLKIADEFRKLAKELGLDEDFPSIFEIYLPDIESGKVPGVSDQIIKYETFREMEKAFTTAMTLASQGKNAYEIYKQLSNADEEIKLDFDAQLN